MSLRGKLTKGRKAIKRGGKKVKRAAKKTITAARKGGQFLLLGPYRAAMSAGLRAKGIKPPTALPALAESFFKNVVRKNSYDEASFFDNEDQIAYVSYEDQFDGLDPITTTAIVSAIVTYIKGVKEKKAAGQPLTKTQAVIAKNAEVAEEKTDEIIDEETSEVIGDYVRKYWWIGALIIAGLLFAKFKGNK